MLECSDCAAILGDYLRPKFFMVLEKENLQAANGKEIIAQTVAVLIMRWIVLFITIASVQYGNAFKPDDGMMPGMIKFALKGADSGGKNRKPGRQCKPSGYAVSAIRLLY